METSNLINLIGILVTTCGLIATIILFVLQQRKTWLLNSATMTTNFVDRFDGSEFRKFRYDFSSQYEKLLNNEPVDMSKCIPILGFFENIGYLTRRGVLDKEMIWNKFSWIVFRYFILLNNKASFIQNLRISQHNKELYSEFEWLYNMMLKISAKKGVHSYSKEIYSQDFLDARINELKEQESNLI